MSISKGAPAKKITNTKLQTEITESAHAFCLTTEGGKSSTIKSIASGQQKN